jgi:hypothetical protein
MTAAERAAVNATDRDRLAKSFPGLSEAQMKFLIQSKHRDGGRARHHARDRTRPRHLWVS